VRSHHPKRQTHHPKSQKHPQSSHSGYGQSAPAPNVPVPVNGRCPDATLSPNESDLDRIRVAVLCLVNRERGSHGESPLAADPRLEQSAQAHTESMVADNYFEHVGPHGETPVSRMRASGYIYSSNIGYEVGENIAWGTLWEGTPRAIVAAWMSDSGHRANILDSRYQNSGIGVSPHPPRFLAHGQAGGIYTQDFGVIMKG
jgi:uncharacterized protein YkwD